MLLLLLPSEKNTSNFRGENYNNGLVNDGESLSRPTQSAAIKSVPRVVNRYFFFGGGALPNETDSTLQLMEYILCMFQMRPPF